MHQLDILLKNLTSFLKNKKPYNFEKDCNKNEDFNIIITSNKPFPPEN